MPKVKNLQKESQIPKPQDIPRTGLLRLPHVLAIIPVGASTWWLGVKKGSFPKPIKLSERVTCWRAEEVWALAEGGETHESHS